MMETACSSANMREAYWPHVRIPCAGEDGKTVKPDSNNGHVLSYATLFVALVSFTACTTARMFLDESRAAASKDSFGFGQRARDASYSPPLMIVHPEAS